MQTQWEAYEPGDMETRARCREVPSRCEDPPGVGECAPGGGVMMDGLTPSQPRSPWCLCFGRPGRLDVELRACTLDIVTSVGGASGAV